MADIAKPNVDALRALANELDRAEELAERLCAPGPKASHVSCSETHEIKNFILAASPLIRALAASTARDEATAGEKAIEQGRAAEDAELLGQGFLVDGQYTHPSRVTVVTRSFTAREGTRPLAPSFGQITITETPAAGGCYAAIQECVMKLPAGVYCVVNKEDLEALRNAEFFSTPSEPTEVVGHKTLSDGHGGFRHEPLTRAEADTLIEHCRSEDERRKALMPDERSAIRMMMDAHIRLTDMGWKDAIYCPKDGTVFEVIEPGSTGIFKCQYEGEWPKGSWWILEDGDMSPSRPVLFRPLSATRTGGHP